MIAKDWIGNVDLEIEEWDANRWDYWEGIAPDNVKVSSRHWITVWNAAYAAAQAEMSCINLKSTNVEPRGLSEQRYG